MSHVHDENDRYQLDQLCLIALSAAFGVVCLTLYFVNTRMLQLMLGPQFHDLVGWSGVFLLGLALVRGIALWRQVRQRHEAHEGCGCGDFPALPAHAHPHDHAHDPAGHDHGWAPWRYIILLVPVFLFMLGLPNKPPKVRATDVDIAPTETIAGYSAIVCEAHDPLPGMVAVVAACYGGPTESVRNIGFMRLHDAPFKHPDLKGTWVRLRAQFAPSKHSDRVFGAARFRIGCCAPDAIQLNVPVACRESLRGLGLKQGDWIDVIGRVDFRRSAQSSVITILKVPSAKFITASPPDPDVYVR